MNKILIAIILVGIAVVLILKEYSFTEALAVGLTIAYLAHFMDKLAKKVVILEGVGLIACLQYLMIPAITYNVFNEFNPLGFAYESFMPIKSNSYYALALPGTLALLIGLHFPWLEKTKRTDKELIFNAKRDLSGKGYLGITLVGIGVIGAVLKTYMPKEFEAIFYFLSQLIFVGAFYLLHTDIRYKSWIVTSILFFLVAQCAWTGMYGEFIYWSFLGAIILLVNKRNVSMMKKLLFLLVGLGLILLIQSVKREYRDKVWSVGVRNNDPAYLANLVIERITDPASILEPTRLYNMTMRANQGFLVAKVVQYVPRHEPFANGETITKAILASLVPRFMWRDKPMSGGSVNRCRFIGDCEKRDYSYNIGQLGEAYANFGITGGVLFMFIYGLFIRWTFTKFRHLAVFTPTLMLWIPLLFYSTLSLETDVVSYLNAFVKSCVLCLFCYVTFKQILGMRL